MNELLSKRLRRVAYYIHDDIKVIADIGSDHAYLPCYVCLQNPDLFAIAGEVNEGPYLAAKKQVEKYELENQIDVRLGDGLSVLDKGEADCITIAGMGGTLIAKILADGKDKLPHVKRLVLQPNIDAHAIREFAVEEKYEIIAEEIIDDEGYIYEILVLEPTINMVNYSEKEMYLGPHLIENKNEVFYEKWQHVLNKKYKIIDQMKNAQNINYEKIDYFSKQVQWIEEEIENDNNS
ncbi:tRNA (adenine(22)-N(1))-methyltransferase TrmK [Filobacillus milosensis]|uniref:tRNA (Adenine(22)-N(1))-methyltransferase TrmK n=1 Tax=Filobacillus milosensis TaxID=94137 RepID=A0A4Y8ISB8_9BACI|nr:tRNA (adenine(22)-N(1))-methyltransferase TrmK [Filobacillus milosensis]TFB24828.1 tRNA (adenine(22)-N(1))-methyltransferase TrmK [Filobacillus milosensis]